MNLTASFLVLLSAAGPARAQQAPAAPVSSQAVVSVDQLYRPVNMRDPLIPATVYGDSMSGAKAPGAKAAEPAKPAAPAKPEAALSSFSVAGMTLAGIMEDYRGKQALLRDASTGAMYTLRGGRLYDQRKKAVPGVSGVVKGRQAVLMTEDKAVHQFALKEKDSQTQVPER